MHFLYYFCALHCICLSAKVDERGLKYSYPLGIFLATCWEPAPYDPTINYVTSFLFLTISIFRQIVQGEWFLSVISNLILTERKHAINFDLKVDSDQGRLGIWYSTTKIQKNILQHPQNLCQNHNTHYIKLKKMVISK